MAPRPARRRSPTSRIWERDVGPVQELTGRDILVIDDEDSVRMVVAAMLETCGAEVATAPSGPIGLGMLEHADYDLVMVDWSMPEMSGREVVRRLKSFKPNVPTILCSGDVGECDNLAAEEQPTSVLQKPFGMDRIASEINQVLTSAEPNMPLAEQR